ncbi:hypothetical protein ABOM_002750 [Aspergillus bombycis]|uniref:F-box domain protein n=1 Tax=Aspergillus bombycis TaxID=109264 RepID=A0A1F8A8C7_9EURO|nr:hypothetical protein ABOM_002750 [Aspergillus bombycis]OGM47957.1 hypothetical protein ABOM_002750 [Aspergillus bombycis]
MASVSGQCAGVDHLGRAPTPEDLHRVYLRTVEGTDTVFNTLLSILRQPALGQYVRHVKLDRAVAYPIEPPDLKTTREINEEDRKLLEGAVRQAGFEGKQHDMMMHIVTHRSRELSFRDSQQAIDLIHLTQALTALIISVAPKLESFAFPVIRSEFDSPSECYLMLQAFLERANANPTKISYLQNLRDVCCLGNKDLILSDERFYENYDLAEQMKLVGNLPAVETIRVDAIEDRHESIELEPRSTNFKKVYIRNSNYSSGSLAEIIKSCRRLEEFEYSIGGRGSVDGSHAMFIERHLLDALLYHTNTLQKLEVDVDEEFIEERPAYWDTEDEYSVGEDPYEGDYVDGRPESLRDFTVMKHLRIGIKLLMALARASIGKGGSEEPLFSLVDILPPNLECLCILGYTVGANSKHDAHISFLMENLDRLPLLKEIAGVDVHIPNAKSVENPDEE